MILSSGVAKMDWNKEKAYADLGSIINCLRFFLRHRSNPGFSLMLPTPALTQDEI